MKRLLPLAALLAPIGIVSAQDRAASPWAITVTPTINPLPLGLCGAVQIAVIDPATREPPRNPQGYRVSLADFDLSVESRGGAVVGRKLDESHWSVCGCPGARVGAEATITATYPSQALKPEARVPNVRSQTTARLVTGAPKGSVSAPGCGVAISATSAPASPPAVTLAAPPDPFALPIAALPAPRDRPYVPGSTTVNISLKGHGSWFEPGAASVAVSLNGQGSWYEPQPASVTISLSGYGNWIEPDALPTPIKVPPKTRSPQ